MKELAISAIGATGKGGSEQGPIVVDINVSRFAHA